MTSTFLAAASEPDAGWGKLVALIITALGFWAFTVGHKRVKQLRETTSKTHSSGPAKVTATTAKPQLTATANEHEGNPPTSRAVVATTPAKRPPRPVDEFVALRLNKMSTTQIVREAEQVLGVSARTAWNAIKDAREKTTAGSP